VLFGEGPEGGAATLPALVRQLSAARTPEDIMAVATHGVRTLLSADGATFVLREGDRCYYADEDAISPLWKGRRFPLNACISGWCMLNRKPAAIREVEADARIPADVYRPTFVRSLAMVPVGSDEPVAALGAYWSQPHDTAPEELDRLKLVADAAALAWRGAAPEPGRTSAAPRVAPPKPAPLPPAVSRAAHGLRGWVERPRGMRPYVLAIVYVLVATLAREMVRVSGVTGLQVFSAYYPAVLLAVLTGGRWAGLLAAVLGGFAAYYFFMSPVYRFVELRPADGINLALYGGASLLIILIIDGYKRLVLRLREEDARHLTLAREQAHRVANALSVIEGVVRQSLRHEPERARGINMRLRAALSEVDMRPTSDAHPRSIRAVLTEELEGFDLSRFELAGPDETPLAAEIAELLALAAHELATNALKYGALSAEAGRVAIDWQVGGGRAKICWREQGGPAVTPPASRGFGGTLLRRLIEARKGAVQLDFRRTGLVAELSLPCRAARLG
jgi:two-component sensor histidine kinase